MAANNAYQRALTKAQRERAHHAREVERLDILIRSLKDFINESVQSGPASKKQKNGARDRHKGLPAKITPKSDRFAKLSAAQAAQAVLKDAGKFLHINDIVQGVLEGGYRGKDPKMVKANLFSALTRRKLFVHHPKEKATFGLQEWDEKDGLFK